MNRLLKSISFLLVLCSVLTIPAHAENAVEPRESAYIAYHDTYLYKTGSNEFQVWFDVTARTEVTQLGVKKIEVYRSSDQTNWTRMITYRYEDYPELMDYGSGAHAGHVTYTCATSGFYYKAYVAFYAKNSTGSGTIYRYTAILQM